LEPREEPNPVKNPVKNRTPRTHPVDPCVTSV
jgi:hypothetical protein